MTHSFVEQKNGLDNTIFFYSVEGPHGVLSNFYPCTFTKRNQTWKSSEHFYQAHKFVHHPDIFEKVRQAPTCEECYKLAWSFQELFREDWKLVKDDIMWEALVAKFTQNPDLNSHLQNTAGKTLIENSLTDFHYGCGIDGSGLNILGKMLMALRNDDIVHGSDTVRTWF